MPSFDYICLLCRNEWEQIASAGEDPDCPSCGKNTVKRLVSAPAAKFVGSGFYENDYKKKDDS